MSCDRSGYKDFTKDSLMYAKGWWKRNFDEKQVTITLAIFVTRLRTEGMTMTKCDLDGTMYWLFVTCEELKFAYLHM